MLRTILAYLLLGMGVCLCVSCVSGPSVLQAPAYPQDVHQVCKNLQQDLLGATSGNDLSRLSDNPAKQAQLYRSYDQYHCDAVLRQR